MNYFSGILLALLAINFATAQNGTDERVINPGVPFLTIAADARSAAIGDTGAATSADVFSQQFNAAKYAFSTKEQGFGISYTPYLTSIVNDISLGQLNYYNKINERSAIGASFRYFGLGDIELRETGDPNEVPIIVSPNELAMDVSYSLKLSETFSMGVTGRYIRSNLRIPSQNNDASSANSFAVDVSGFYQSEETFYDSFNGVWRFGFNLQNIGPKISYDTSDISTNFLPTNLKVGGGFDFIFDDYNKIALNLELNKFMVPSPQNPDLNGDGTVTSEESATNNANYNRIGWAEGIFKSFGDASDGFSEELKEITYGLGSEYWYQDTFAFRAGYFYESPDKGKRQYFTMGAGFVYQALKVDLSYLFSTSKVPNPLENTLRFSLTFNFGDDY